MQIGERCAAWSGEKEPSAEWLDGYAYALTGVLVENQNESALITFIPVIGGHSMTWANTGVEGKSYVIEYDANQKRIDYWYEYDERTLSLGSNCKYIRLSAALNNKNLITVHDDTDGVYLFQNGKIVNGGGYNRKCVRRSYRRSSRPSARFWRTPLAWEVAA